MSEKRPPIAVEAAAVVPRSNTKLEPFASKAVGRENVVAGTDCGLGGRVHPDLAWAKLSALAEGARLASKALWPR